MKYVIIKAWTSNSKPGDVPIAVVPRIPRVVHKWARLWLFVALAPGTFGYGFVGELLRHPDQEMSTFLIMST